VVDLTTGRLPPGQSATRRFPVVGETAPGPDAAAATDLGRWRLRVEGLVARPRSFRYDEVLALPQRDLRVDVHCVTGWTRFATSFTGVPLVEVVDLAGGPLPGARFVRFEASSARRHDTSLPIDTLAECWLVHTADGRPLDVAHGWPLRVVTPSRYFYKSLKWVRLVELRAEDRLGYWERESAYHNNADPWAGDQRFTSGSLRPAQLAALRRSTDLGRWRGRALIGLDLRDWAPATASLAGLQLKGCDLRGARLAAADLRGANLSLSDLRGADLRGADLRGADVEGADFTGGDLRGADLTGAACSATRFVAPSDAAGGQACEGALVAGLRWVGVTGLLEEQEAYLRERAAPSAPA
jgi:DMSO/TMAO reductase YedYZ molybdopterin-dependent catalytic subunit